MEGATPGARNVAAKILGRSGLITSTRNIKQHVSTPSEDATPKTLIGGILDAASISKSGLVAPQTRKSKLTKSPATRPQAKRNKALRQSLGDNPTPRTIIQNFLMEASPETPLQVPLELPKNNIQDDSIETSTSFLPNDVRGTPASSSQSGSGTTENLNPNPKENSDHPKDSSPNAEDNESLLAVEAGKENDALLQEHSESDDSEDAKVSSPAPVNTKADIPEESLNQATDSSTTIASDEQESQSDSTPDADNAMPSYAMDDSSDPPRKRVWKELVTPHLPVKRSNVLSEKQMVEEEEEKESERTTKAARKQQPPPKKTTKTKSSSSGDTNLPSSLVKSIFQHFSKSRISRNTLSSIEKGSSLFFKQISSDLMAYCKHAGRSTIEIGDVELLMKRQGFITDKQSLHSLIEKHLPLEYRQELIPVVQSGNNVLLKKSN